MADESTSSRGYGTILLGGVISLIVGVAGGFFVNRLTERRAALEYDVVLSAQFSGETQKLAIVAVGISNPADKEVEELNCSIDLRGEELREAKIVGLNLEAYKQTVKDGIFRLSTPFLNPRESFSIQLLLSSANPERSTPYVTVLGKGVTGTPRITGKEKSTYRDLLPLFVAAGGASLSLLTLRRLRGSLPFLFTRKHSGDQRDIFAFVLSTYGFTDLARWYWTSGRPLSYWSIADELTESALRTSQQDAVARALRCLESLLEYAGIATDSRLLIHLNAARLAAHSGDKTKAEQYLAAARKGNHPIIEARIKMSRELESEVQKLIVETG